MNFIGLLKSKLAEGKSSKIINNLIVIIIICVIALIAYSVFMPKDMSKKDNSSLVSTEEEAEASAPANYADDMETRLEEILGKINGVGKVEVLITYDTTTEVVPAFDVTESKQVTEEEDNQGGIRTINQENTSSNLVTISGQNSENKPVVIKEIKPIIRGVIVVAEGAENPVVKADLIDAVTTIFQVKSNKVKIYGAK